MIISGLDGNEEDDEQEDVKTPDIPNDIQNPTEKIFRMGMDIIYHLHRKR